MRLPSLGFCCRTSLAAILLIAPLPTAFGDSWTRPTKAQRAVEEAQQAALDAEDAMRASAKEKATAAEAEAASKLSPEAEAEIIAKITRSYREATLRYQQRDFLAAHNAFMDCYALCQLASKSLSDPKKLETIQKECEQRLEQLRGFDKLESAANGWKQRLAQMQVPRFQVNDAELATVLELIRKRAGELGKCPPPSFTLMLPRESLQQKVTLDVTGLPMLAVLEMVVRMAHAEARFERYTVVIANSPLVQR